MKFIAGKTYWLDLTKHPDDYTTNERREMLSSLTRKILDCMVPNCYGRYSAKQIDYAKGRAWKEMQEAGF